MVASTSFTKIFVKLSYFLRLNNNNVLSKFKHDFSQDRSTERAIVECIQILYGHMDVGEHVVPVYFIWFSKPFAILSLIVSWIIHAQEEMLIMG